MIADVSLALLKKKKDTTLIRKLLLANGHSTLPNEKHDQSAELNSAYKRVVAVTLFGLTLILVLMGTLL